MVDQSTVDALRHVMDENLKTTLDLIQKIQSDVSELKNQVGINCKKLDETCKRIDELPLKIKQDLLPELTREVRNSVKTELEKKF